MDPALHDTLRALTAAEDAAQTAARARAREVTAPPAAEVGAFLAWLAATATARHVVEVGSSGGVTGLWLLRGMPERGVLTSVEADNAVHGVATSAFEHAKRTDQVRSIFGDPGDVLPRLSDQGYELCVLRSDQGPAGAMLQHARRLLKPGGLIAMLGLERGESLRAFADLVDENADVVGSALPVAGGLGVATIG